MRSVIKSEWVELHDVGHGYTMKRVKFYDDGFIQPNWYYAFDNNEAYKMLWAKDHRIQLPKKFRDYLRAYAALKTS